MEVEELAAAHDKMLESYQKATANAQKEFEAMVAKAQNDLAKLIASANQQVTQAPPPVKPAAQWIKAKDDEELLVLNKPAAEFFSAIFEQIGVIAVELSKMSNKK